MKDEFFNRISTYVRGSTTLPQAYFTSDQVFRREQEAIFSTRWICAGRAQAIKRPGDFFTLTAGTESLIVVRDRAGQINAFYNVCRHRGTRLCDEPSGRFAETIQCPYHAWTYALDGRLVGAPFMAEVPGFDKADYPLHRAAVAEWEGFIFINLNAEPAPFEQAFAALDGRFARFSLPGLQASRRCEYLVGANWKLIVQNYSECLHCPTLHPALARISPFQSGENDLVDGPFLGGYMEIAPDAASLTLSGRACGLPVGKLPGPDLRRVYYYTIFPNMLLSLHPDYVMVHLLWPLGPDRTYISCDWLFHPKSFLSPGFDPEDAIGFWDMTNRQDWAICERSQAGIASRLYRPGPYSARESLLAAWDREYLSGLSGPDLE